MESCDILLKYFNFYKLFYNSINDNKNVLMLNDLIKNLSNIKENSKFTYIDKIDRICDLLNNDQIINYFNSVKDTNSIDDDIKSVFEKGIDYVLYDILFYINKLNLYLMNNKVKSIDIPLSMDIKFNDLDIKLKNVLDYLEVKDDDLDKDLISDLNNYVDLEKFKDLSIVLKTDNGMKRVLFDKIEDKNVLISIMLHSNIDIINAVLDIFDKESVNINKVASNIPSIFIEDLINSKCKYNSVLCDYNNFVNNYNLIKKYDLSFKKMINNPIFFINQVEKNINILNNIETISGGFNNE